MCLLPLALTISSVVHSKYCCQTINFHKKSAYITILFYLNVTGCLYLVMYNTKFFCSPLRHSKFLLLPIFPTYSLLIFFLTHSGLLVQNFFVCLGSANGRPIIFCHGTETLEFTSPGTQNSHLSVNLNQSLKHVCLINTITKFHCVFVPFIFYFYVLTTFSVLDATALFCD